MARPINRQKTRNFEITVPQTAYDYLVFLASNSILGATENAVAANILTAELKRMLESGFHNLHTPRMPDADAD